MTTHNHDYDIARAAAERAKAAASPSPDVAAVHRELAEMYEQRARQPDDRSHLKIVGT